MWQWLAHHCSPCWSHSMENICCDRAHHWSWQEVSVSFTYCLLLVCVQICRNESGGHTHQDLFIYVYSKGHHNKRLRAYTILDDQNNKSLPRSSLFDTFGIDNHFPIYFQDVCRGVGGNWEKSEQFHCGISWLPITTSLAHAYWMWHAPWQSKWNSSPWSYSPQGHCCRDSSIWPPGW